MKGSAIEQNGWEESLSFISVYGISISGGGQVVKVIELCLGVHQKRKEAKRKGIIIQMN